MIIVRRIIAVAYKVSSCVYLTIDMYVCVRVFAAVAAHFRCDDYIVSMLARRNCTCYLYFLLL